ncbi:mannose-specific lectin-like [Poecilia formosa]|uniref:mannose-specific lectin-like n=1 Tax=Poecilia formosa TaxID=48698 RepID=UPI0007B94FD0|nr:PREDICTED: mannose-specific lectin-like [Poecilia formosa]
MSKNYMSKNDELRKGDYLMSNNGQWKAVFQNDGNFVVYGWKPTWASDTCGSDVTRLVMQKDCNLVMYNENNQPRWATGTNTPPKDGYHVCRLYLSDEGILHLSEDSQELWNSTKPTGN